MPKRRIKYHRYVIFILSVLILLAICYFDYFTGQLGFFIFYFIPIVLLAWYWGKWYGVGMSLASSICWLAADYYSDIRYSNFALAVWDTLVVRGGSFIIAAVAVSMLRDSLEKQKTLDKDLTTALSHLEQLKNVISICAACKERKDCNCYLEQIEQYIKDHSRKKPSLSECPKCISEKFPELWGELLEDLKKKEA